MPGVTGVVSESPSNSILGTPCSPAYPELANAGPTGRPPVFRVFLDDTEPSWIAHWHPMDTGYDNPVSFTTSSPSFNSH